MKDMKYNLWGYNEYCGQKCLLFRAVDVIFMDGPGQDVLDGVVRCWGDDCAHDGSWVDIWKGLENTLPRLGN